MTSSRPLRHLAALLGLALLALPAGPAAGQSTAELRRENERLRTQAADLQRELDAARRRIADLETEIARLAAGGAGPARTVAPPPPEPVTIDESTADASPRGLFRAVQESYQEAVGETQMGMSQTDPARVAFMRDLVRWAARVNREYKMKIDWHVRLIGAAVPVRRGYVVRLQAVDPITDTRLGDPFDALLSRPIVSHLQLLEQRQGLDEVMQLRGTLLPRMYVNAQRPDEGPFNNPPLIGPYAEFGFAVEAQSLAPPREESAAEQEPAAEDASGS